MACFFPDRNTKLLCVEKFFKVLPLLLFPRLLQTTLMLGFLPLILSLTDGEFEKAWQFFKEVLACEN